MTDRELKYRYNQILRRLLREGVGMEDARWLAVPLLYGQRVPDDERYWYLVERLRNSQ